MDEDEVHVYEENTPISRMSNAIISNAIDNCASEIYIEALTRQALIRARVDGLLQEVMWFPRHLLGPLAERYRVMANLDPAGERAQTGIIRIKHNNHDYQLRVSLAMTHLGESIVIHVLIQEDAIVGLKSLGMRAGHQVQLEELTAHPSGLVLLAGPSNSGLTTTAYNLLNKLKSVERKVFTLEPLPEYKLSGITQVFTDYTNEYINQRPCERRDAFDTILRQDPDVLFVGDVGDAKTAADAIKAATSGVLVLATIGAPDSLTALSRLKDYGVSTDCIAQHLIGAVSQRLVGRLCENCKAPYSVPAEEVRWFFEGSKDVPPTDTVTLYRSEGCDVCDNKGYKGYLGRVGLFEVLTMNHEIRELLILNAPFPDLQVAARATGFKPLRRDGMEKMLAGITASNDVYDACL